MKPRAAYTPAAAPAKAVSGQILARKERDAREAVFPDLRNFGIVARALVLYLAMVAAYALATANSPTDAVINLTLVLADSLPVAACIGMAWAFGSPYLRRLAYWQAATALLLFTALLVWAWAHWLRAPVWRAVPLSLIALAAVLVYFHTLGRALSPAVTEARLQALQARIRPHFLFNSINGVLGVLRAEPKRAEAALEDMADLFRVLMRENRTLQPLQDEITLTRQYLNLEKLRLGDRLNVVWKLEKMP